MKLPVWVETVGVSSVKRLELLPALAFAVHPPLPTGLSVDAHTGALRGTALQAHPRQTHTVTVSTQATGPGGVELGVLALAQCTVSLRIEDLRGHRVCSTREVRDATGRSRLVVEFEDYGTHLG